MRNTCHDCQSDWCMLRGSSEESCTGYTPPQERLHYNDNTTGFDPDAFKYDSTHTIPEGDPYKKPSKRETIS